MALSLLTVSEAKQHIQNGKVLAYPTEAVYGLGCDPFDEAAFNRLLALKQRSIEKGVILIASQLSQIESLVTLSNQPWAEQVLSSWQAGQAPTTWVLPATDQVPTRITGGRDTVAVRITQHPEVVALCDALQSPLVSTSANVSGQEAIKSAELCHENFPNTPILAGALSGAAQPSQIWHALTGERLR